MAPESLGRALSLLDAASLHRRAADLANTDSRFSNLLERDGPPPLWARPAGFPTLVKIILEQQVSLNSAAAAFRNLELALGEVSPTRFLRLDNVQLRKIGFSRQKAGYCRGLAEGMLDGSVDLAGMSQLGDEAARRRLTALRGIGPWTADVYLLFVLLRPDIWPDGDRALVVSIAEQFELAAVPTYEAAGLMAESWRPWRSVAARMLWQAYLLRRGRSLD